ncbi:Hemicentin 2 [Desmophyllum pertusum]|uniref:Hemicentin 2 n=1 Tax=Desmophyllum pertusum TaxID=174260 RepID=A0A9X0A5Q2_9CNID|nr:Hemicentin 2 [Desmophyllum pertusum]
MRGKARCLVGECHCINPVSYGDGKYNCDTKHWSDASDHMIISLTQMEDHLVSIIANVQYFVRGVAVRTDGAIVIRGPGRTTCSNNDGCKPYAYCFSGVCHCRDELLGDGTTCRPAPRHKCKSKKDCHPFAKCLTGHCICYDSAGNGKYCRIGWTGCYKSNPCGWNSICALDPLIPDHAWCLCEIGTDKHGDCIECTKDEHCKSFGRCEDNKCFCRDELTRAHSRCIRNHALPCASDWRMGCGQGVCLIDPLLPKDVECKCNKGYIDEFPYGCIECRSNRDCRSYSTCVNRVCKCRAEMIKKGKTCTPAALHKCRNSRDCHPKAKCFYGKCICQGETTGTGRQCRKSLPCSNVQRLSCGDHAGCLVDPSNPEEPICRCHKGFKMSKDNKCLDVDECKSSKARCGHRCRNTVGSFHCVPCPPGYTEGRDGACNAPDQCDCGEHEECYDGECVCEEGYEISKFGDCVWPDDEWLSVDKANVAQAFSDVCVVALGLFGYQAIAV